MFTKQELAALNALYEGKSQKKVEETSSEQTMDSLRHKLGVDRTGEMLERFQAMTGWSNPPKDYA